VYILDLKSEIKKSRLFGWENEKTEAKLFIFVKKEEKKFFQGAVTHSILLAQTWL